MDITTTINSKKKYFQQNEYGKFISGGESDMEFLAFPANLLPMHLAESSLFDQYDF